MEETKKKPGRPKKAVVNDNVKDTTNTTIETVKKPKERLVMKDTDEVVVRSNVFGELIYINDRTGDQIIWENCEEEQVMSAKDVRDMKAKQQSFFKEGWISIVDSPDVDFDELKAIIPKLINKIDINIAPAIIKAFDAFSIKYSSFEFLIFIF